MHLILEVYFFRLLCFESTNHFHFSIFFPPKDWVRRSLLDFKSSLFRCAKHVRFWKYVSLKNDDLWIVCFSFVVVQEDSAQRTDGSVLCTTSGEVSNCSRITTRSIERFGIVCAKIRRVSRRLSDCACAVDRIAAAARCKRRCCTYIYILPYLDWRCDDMTTMIW